MKPSSGLSALRQLPSVGSLAKGLVPLFISGAVGPMGPQAIVGSLKALVQWKFLPAGLLAISAAREPFHTAIVDDGGSMTYRELNEQTAALAKALFRTGIRERHRIGVLCRNHRGFILALTAHGRLGTDIIFFNTGASATQTRRVIEEQKLDLLIIDEEFLPLLPSGFHACPVIIAWEFGDTVGSDRNIEMAATPASNVREAMDSGNYAQRHPDWPSLHEVISTSPANQTIPAIPRMGRTIILTSGTTGTPKGARRPEPLTYLPASSIMNRIPLRHRRPVFLSAPMFHTWGFAQIQLALVLRNTMILQRVFTPQGALKVIEKNRPYAIAMVPTMLRRLLEVVPEGFESSVKIIATSGEALPPRVIEDTFRKFGDVLYNLYGSTEVSWASIARPEELKKHPRTAGKPPLATTVKIIGDDGQELPEKSIGRIFVKNDMLFEGYTRPGTDKETIAGMIATGDLGYYEDGLLYIAGRSDDMVVSGGENVFPQETEDIINQREDVLESAVHGIDDDEFGQALCAWIVMRGKAADDLSDSEKEQITAQIKADVKSALARQNVPRKFVFLDKLPRNAVGKVVPRLLPEK